MRTTADLLHDHKVDWTAVTGERESPRQRLVSGYKFCMTEAHRSMGHAGLARTTSRHLHYLAGTSHTLTSEQGRCFVL